MIGPDGGNVRSLAYDPSNPSHILIGTSAGQIFASQDGGNSWTLFAHLGTGEDYVLDHIIFDPTNTATIYAAGWDLFDDTAGDVFRSDDGGLTWKALPGTHGKSIRALAMAPSDHNTLVIGALDGVFRTRDGGQTWTRMTPENPEVMENHASMKNFVSVAVDPENPDVVYAGTRHLAWKTSDGGQNWHNVKDGMLDDSDVFSIIVDPKVPSKVYASACSGIYRSDNGAELFHRVQGLPHSAIRTRVLKMDPQHSSTVYAGTTGGLWKTVDGGARWTLVTSENVIVNDVLIDPRNSERVLVATDLGGVLASNDGFAHYAASNRGFSHRVVGDVVVDRKDPNRLYAGVANDRTAGGVFIWDDTGKHWRQSNRGIEDRDVLSLQQAEDGTLFAGTNHGIFYLDPGSETWKSASMIMGTVPEWRPKEAAPEAPAPTKKSTHTSAAHSSAAHRRTTTAKSKAPVEPVIPSDTAPKIRSLSLGQDAWFAATNEGLFISVDHGKKWYGELLEGENNFVAVNSYADGSATLVTNKIAFLSHDGGKTWGSLQIPEYAKGLYNLTMTPDSSLWLAAREGAMESVDGGKTWRYVVGGLPNKDVLAVRYDDAGQRLLATVLHEHGIFASSDKGKTWQRVGQSDVAIVRAIDYQGRLLAISSHNGLLLQDSDTAAKTAEKAAAGMGTKKSDQ